MMINWVQDKSDNNEHKEILHHLWNLLYNWLKIIIQFRIIKKKHYFFILKNMFINRVQLYKKEKTIINK